MKIEPVPQDPLSHSYRALEVPERKLFPLLDCLKDCKGNLLAAAILTLLIPVLLSADFAYSGYIDISNAKDCKNKSKQAGWFLINLALNGGVTYLAYTNIPPGVFGKAVWSLYSGELSSSFFYNAVPKIPKLASYIKEKCCPDSRENKGSINSAYLTPKQ